MSQDAGFLAHFIFLGEQGGLHWLIKYRVLSQYRTHCLERWLPCSTTGYMSAQGLVIWEFNDSVEEGFGVYYVMITWELDLEHAGGDLTFYLMSAVLARRFNSTRA